MEIKCVPKNADFHCIYCDFKCSKKSNFESHCNTKKHLHRVSGNKMENMEIKKNAENICKCGKKYNTKSGLWKHIKNCNFKDSTTENTIDKNEITDKDLIMNLLMENKELKTMMIGQQTMMMEVIKNGTHNTTHTNSHNKSFNLQFFLNETCKDAMNITDFVESIQLQLSDLESLGDLGYVDGISNIIIKNLRDLDITKRPVHCTDKKREIMYVKDEGKWEKDESQQKMHKIVRKVADKNSRMLPRFKEAHPDCIKSTSKFNDQYTKLVIEALGGRGGDDFAKEEKIIRKISKVVTVNKDV